jgi:hypothetical protein
MNQSHYGHYVSAALSEYTVSLNTQRVRTMTFNEQKQEIDAQMIILGFGYATVILVAVGWVATLVY